MNKTLASAALGVLSLASLSVGLTSKVDAFSQTVLPIENSTVSPQPVAFSAQAPETAQQSTQEIAQVVCDTEWINGQLVSCCADASGNWACVW